MVLFYCEEIQSRAQAYGLLAWAVRHHWGLDPLPELVRNAQGKPFFPDHPEYQFNLSHSGRMAACVLDEHPVGVDAERLRPHHPRLPQRICSPAELAWLNGEPDVHRALCRLWTLKECRVKQNGIGLTVPIRSISIPLPPPCGACTQHDGLTFFTLDSPDWSISACGQSSLTAVIPVRAAFLPPSGPCFLPQSENKTD